MEAGEEKKSNDDSLPWMIQEVGSKKCKCFEKHIL